MNERLRKQIASGLAALRDLESAGFDEVLEAKAHGPQVRFFAEEPTSAGERRLRYVWSTEVVDRMGDIVRQNWDLGPFTRNPVALWGHDHDAVLGRATNFGLELDGKRKLVGDIEFAPEGVSEFVDEKWRFASAGLLPMVSVGFLPKKVDSVRDADQRKELGLGDYGVVFEENELLEISVVGVPANPEAEQIRSAVERGLLTPDDVEKYARQTQPTERDWFRRLERLAATRSVPTVGHEMHPEEIHARFDALELAISELKNALPQGDAHGVDRAVDQPGSGSGWDIADVLGLFTDGVTRGLGSTSQTTEVPNG